MNSDHNSLGPTLLKLARDAIAQKLGAPATEPNGAAKAVEPAEATALQQPAACFVTLMKNGRLRGCIGSLEAWRPLLTDLRENASAAAFRDPRFPPLEASELADTRVEVSLLAAPVSMQFSSEADALQQLQPTIDGIILECDGRRATFLPQVWEQLPTPKQFMAHLKQKAGLPPDFWNDHIQLWRYRVEKWKED